MNKLAKYLDGQFIQVPIDLKNTRWHIHAHIPRQSGWYFISTDTPIKILRQQSLWKETYTTKLTNQLTRVKNYNIKARADRFNKSLTSFVNTAKVYSGMASNLNARAREHTSPDPGTGGLALMMYPALRKFKWEFNYLTLSDFMRDCSNEKMILKFGEQIWRSKNGWPILCEE